MLLQQYIAVVLGVLGVPRYAANDHIFQSKANRRDQRFFGLYEGHVTRHARTRWRTTPSNALILQTALQGPLTKRVTHSRLS